MEYQTRIDDLKMVDDKIWMAGPNRRTAEPPSRQPLNPDLQSYEYVGCKQGCK